MIKHQTSLNKQMRGLITTYKNTINCSVEKSFDEVYFLSV